MVKFLVKKKSDLKDFLTLCSIPGTLMFRETKSVKKPLFESFYLDVMEDKLQVLTLDPHRKKTNGLFTMSEVEVYETGRVPIMDFDALEDVLKGRGLPSKNIVFESESDGNIIKIYSEDKTDSYTIRQRDDPTLARLFSQDKKIKGLKAWKEWNIVHEEGKEYDKLDEDIVKNLVPGVLYFHHPSVEEPIPYSMKLKVNVSDLEKIVGDSLKLTKDNKTLFVFRDQNFYGKKGKDNARLTSKHTIKYEDQGIELVEFEKKFFFIQIIVPNLLENTTFNFRRVQSDGSISIHIISENEDGSLRAELGIVSIIED